MVVALVSSGWSVSSDPDEVHSRLYIQSLLLLVLLATVPTGEYQQFSELKQFNKLTLLLYHGHGDRTSDSIFRRAMTPCPTYSNG